MCYFSLYTKHVEKLYYSCRFEPICIHCDEYVPNETEDEDCDAYPQRNKCGDKAKIIKRATK
jgi:hypothetical protein